MARGTRFWCEERNFLVATVARGTRRACRPGSTLWPYKERCGCGKPALVQHAERDRGAQDCPPRSRALGNLFEAAVLKHAQQVASKREHKQARRAHALGSTAARFDVH